MVANKAYCLNRQENISQLIQILFALNLIEVLLFQP